MSQVDWRRDGLCIEIGGEPFFVDKDDDIAAAKDICRRCPVRTQCLDHALALEDAGVWAVMGIWGGLTQDERRALRHAVA